MIWVRKREFYLLLEIHFQIAWVRAIGIINQSYPAKSICFNASFKICCDGDNYDSW